MKKLLLLSLSLLLCSPVYAWQSETGGGVVSANSNVVITSIEATQVLKSDALSSLLGETDLGGSVNFASFNSGGILSFKNVVSSRDTVIANSDEYVSWGIVNGKNIRVGLSADNTFVIPDNLNALGASFNNVQILSGGILRDSGDAVFVKVSVPTVAILSGGILSSSSDTVLSNVSVNNIAVLSGGVFRTSSDSQLVNASGSTVSVSTQLKVSGDSALTKTSATTTFISSTLKVSGQTSIVGPLQIVGSTIAALPNVSAIGVAIAFVTDGTSNTDCTSGGGKFPNICLSSGNSTWVDA